MSVNIWESIEFEAKKGVSAKDLLEEQKEKLEKETNNILTLEIESMDSYLENKSYPNDVQIVLLYFCYIKAPLLGGYRRQLLTIIEGKYNENNFPVDIISTLDKYNIEKVEEEKFLDEVKDILNRKNVKLIIQDLYRRSLYFKENKLEIES